MPSTPACTRLATELQRAGRDNSLYVLDEPTTGLHPADVQKLMTQLQGLVPRGTPAEVARSNEGCTARFLLPWL
jgi:hypothetical protein